jgi:hypothetical protein
VPFPIEETELVATEEKLGAKFPTSFRERMMRQNGGEINAGDDVWRLFPFLDASDKKRLSRTCNDIVRETEVAKGWRGFPHNAVAIGANGAGDHLIFLKQQGKDGVLESAVYWWDHETGQTHWVCADFSDLG